MLKKLHKVPKHYEPGKSEPEHLPTTKDHYQQIYFEVFDLAGTSIADRFVQPGFKIYSNVEQLLFQESLNENYIDKLNSFCDFYEGTSIR